MPVLIGKQGYSISRVLIIDWLRSHRNTADERQLHFCDNSNSNTKPDFFCQAKRRNRYIVKARQVTLGDDRGTERMFHEASSYRVHHRCCCFVLHQSKRRWHKIGPAIECEIPPRSVSPYSITPYQCTCITV